MRIFTGIIVVGLVLALGACHSTPKVVSVTSTVAPTAPPTTVASTTTIRATTTTHRVTTTTRRRRVTATTAAPPQDVYYANCSEARAAGAAPLYRGEPGYRPALDRDGDGVACE